MLSSPILFMETKFYSVYAGHYSSPKIPKSDAAKLKEMGFTPYVFAVKNGYSLKVFSTPKLDLAQNVVSKIIRNGIGAWWE